LVIAAYQVELYFYPMSYYHNDKQPVEVCRYENDGSDYYGYRICINMISATIINVLLCTTLLIIDLLIPCLNSGVSKECLCV